MRGLRFKVQSSKFRVQSSEFKARVAVFRRDFRNRKGQIRVS